MQVSETCAASPCAVAGGALSPSEPRQRIPFARPSDREDGCAAGDRSLLSPGSGGAFEINSHGLGE